MWNDAFKQYVSQTIEKCRACRAPAPPQPNRKFSISSIFQELNYFICMKHFYLDSLRILHSVYNTTGFTATFIVNEDSMNNAVLSFQIFWMNQFWTPRSTWTEEASTDGEFKNYYNDCGTKISL